jgi:hypothetical protein
MRIIFAATLALLLPELALSADKQIKIRVAETVGISRFGYPVSVVLPVAEPVKDTDHFRLLDGDKPVSAQFRPHGDTSKGIRAVSLDFNASPWPLEKHDYVVEYGPGVATSEPKSGLRVETREKEFRIVHPGGLQFVVPRDLAGLLKQVQTKKLKFLNSESIGLMSWNGEDKRFFGGEQVTVAKTPNLVPIKLISSVVKEGPLAVGLRFEGSGSLDKVKHLPFTVEMDFPISKSWVRVAWTMDDEKGNVPSLGVHLNLHVEGEPTLIDFGAGTLVYAQLRQSQAVRLRQNPRERPSSTPLWETSLGVERQLKPFVVAAGAAGAARNAEGWAHVMDRERCTAVAVADFAESQEGAEILVDADGSLRLWRHFGKPGGDVPRGKKQLMFWLHFVDMPVHVGAATSPQAMLAPLKVEIGDKP